MDDIELHRRRIARNRLTKTIGTALACGVIAGEIATLYRDGFSWLVLMAALANLWTLFVWRKGDQALRKYEGAVDKLEELQKRYAND